MAIKYTEEQLLRFKNRQLLIMSQSIFSSLCMLHANQKDEKELMETAMEMAEYLYSNYPMEIDMVDVNRNKAKSVSGDEPF